jgi:hypothetical protein
MKLFVFLWGFFTFSTAMPSEMGRGQEVPPPESQRADRKSTQLQLAQPKEVATVHGINQSLEIRQPFVVPTVFAVGIPGVGLLAAIATVITIVVTAKEDNEVRNSWILQM